MVAVPPVPGILSVYPSFLVPNGLVASSNMELTFEAERDNVKVDREGALAKESWSAAPRPTASLSRLSCLRWSIVRRMASWRSSGGFGQSRLTLKDGSSFTNEEPDWKECGIGQRAMTWVVKRRSKRVNMERGSRGKE